MAGSASAETAQSLIRQQHLVPKPQQYTSFAVAGRLIRQIYTYLAEAPALVYIFARCKSEGTSFDIAVSRAADLDPSPWSAPDPAICSCVTSHLHGFFTDRRK